jgi:hypothetical protein
VDGQGDRGTLPRAGSFLSLHDSRIEHVTSLGDTFQMKRPSNAARVLTRVIDCVLGAFMLWIFGGSIACPRLIRVRMYTQEVAAIAAVRTIHTAQTQYRSNFHRYAGSLQELAAAGTIQLATDTNPGYNFEMAGTQDGYTISARSAVFNSTGSRTFYSDQTMVIHEHYGPEPATMDDPETK